MFYVYDECEGNIISPLIFFSVIAEAESPMRSSHSQWVPGNTRILTLAQRILSQVFSLLCHPSILLSLVVMSRWIGSVVKWQGNLARYSPLDWDQYILHTVLVVMCRSHRLVSTFCVKLSFSDLHWNFGSWIKAEMLYFYRRKLPKHQYHTLILWK